MRPRRLLAPALSLLVAVLLAAPAAPLAAQERGACELAAGVGVGLTGGAPTRPDVTGSDVLESGLDLALDATCHDRGWWLVGVGAERMDLDDAILWTVSGAAGLRSSPSPGLALSGRLRAGLGTADDRTEFLPLPGLDRTGFLDLDDSGLLLGADFRVSQALSPPFAVFANVGWRVVWLERIGSGTDAEAVHLFPLTTGLAVRF